MQQITATVGTGNVLAENDQTHIRWGPLVVTMSRSDAAKLAADLIAARVIDDAILAVAPGGDGLIKIEVATLRAELRERFGVKEPQ